MSTTEEATVNPDGTTSFASEEGGGAGADDVPPSGDEADFDTESGDVPDDAVKGTDPAIFLFLGFLLIATIWFFFYYKKRKDQADSEAFFSNMDGEKFNLKLPAAVEEYYEVKAKCEEAGWEPGQAVAKDAASANGPHRMLAQALMKRCIQDIPLVQHIQKESPGMNKLYSHSMCSVKQWKAYQAAEAMVSAEVDEVRAEADEIEPGWSQVIWRQAMQYHQMLKQRQDMEQKAMAAQAAKKQVENDKVAIEKKKVDDKKAKEEAAEKAAKELMEAEEKEKGGGAGLKKGFLSGSSKKK
uniref:Uncharacterized protein n=1 Tax=Pseudictyota dubia TaxID=2749911 RepID=A0A7R9ZDY6_9STRA|mmetsp:Transcript_41764/g.77273  ORF Transcript_41764/g.77273 Transcript_41764/m.77273 type:complete len:298 (+) Transcript_41764:139-1032(+)|eukprot:CAMPEP_0197439072 /NCGR_PEP_ID=MMETSP1175-20131217/5887_1 /TAXON_ID=1003142 /ORGANISM="Triceratium dubium, Strain CCMP147" /LENGTH=297 /DNA_ID=CAMNT_0042968903 /DNA_START=129 /DNA_END=1022 /DNA_ORIENTATION=-